ncbi:MAG TPA: cytochrome c oxidase assembly protein [Acidobacteriaceae bacterium]|nr:cytochrome c oxidase assembly protein [Acidobacteriaceae bacterium]
MPLSLAIVQSWTFPLWAHPGLFSLWIALASPVDALNEFLLVAHMTQHLLLMSIAPPLLLPGNPVVPMLRGLPRSFVRDELAS